MFTIINGYKSLSPKQKKLIEIMSTPGNNYLSVTALCKLAGISRVTYYHYFDSMEFVKAYDRMTRDMIKAAVIPILNAAIREGKRGSYQDRKMLLEMSGIYTTKASLGLEIRGFEDLLSNLADKVSEGL